MKLGMKKVLTVALLSTVVLVLTSCGTTTSQIAFHEVTTNDHNDAIVYIYRLPNIVGAAVKWPVKLDGKEVAALKQNAYVVLYTAPGVHRITVGANEIRTFTAAPNGVYFFRTKGILAYGVTREKAMEEIVDMKYDMGL